MPQESGASPRFEIRQVPRPQPGPNELLVKLTLTSVCGTDCALAAGHLGPTRAVLGHEGVGTISALGSGVPSLDPSVEVGQRVGVAWIRDACGTCGFCVLPSGETRCVGLFHSGRSCDGTFAEYAVVPWRYMTRIPPRLDSVPDELVAPVLCGGVTAYKAIKECHVLPGQYVAISGGGGGVGALGVQYASAMGYRVVAVDAGEEKGRYALALGAEHYVDITKEKDLGVAVKKLTDGRGCNGVIIATGAGAAYQSAFEMLAPYGTYMCVGIPPPNQTVNFHPIQFINNGAKVTGSAVGTRQDILEALEFVKRGVVSPKVEEAKLEDMESILKWVSEGKIQGKYIIRF
ncbi:hypothetical protein MKZ38_008907 [Zalerion maritima]|uniref:alcohol dehydrogenase n=1 Tax=Zalerion maritima TaxID=339359 RepID=A0AAD5WMA2_9PEZI|nr:hypothetical protein MKZ38_008907 [Zalerion maritima]